MNPYDFVHLSILAVGDEIKGRTKLQKTIYFLGVLTGRLPELGYRAHYYGPYSDAVANSINRLKSLGFLTENTIGAGAVGRGGFEIARHDFKLTEEGKRIAQEKASRNPEIWKGIKSVAVKFLEAGEVDYMKMSVAAKTFYILSDSGKPATPGELSNSASKLGWNPTPQEVEESINFLERLGLVKTKGSN
jgi:uncharacterized protein YwgA